MNHEYTRHNHQADDFSQNLNSNKSEKNPNSKKKEKEEIFFTID